MLDQYTVPENAEMSLSYLYSIPLVWYAKWSTGIIGALILLLGIMMMMASVSDERLFNKKKKLILPSEVMRPRYSFKHKLEQIEIMHDDIDNKS